VLKRLLATVPVVLLLLLQAHPAGAATGSVWHVVAPGETMASIAADHGLDIADLGRWNQIVPPYPVHLDETLRLTEPDEPLQSWRTHVEPVTPAMLGWDPRRGCPVSPDQLRRVWVSYIDLQGAYHDGSLIVRQDVVARTQQAFFTLFRWRYRIMVMAPVSVNMPGLTNMGVVTAGYNCRPVAGTNVWSEHAYGTAIDLNPLQNPMIRSGWISPRGGEDYLDRDRHLIGMVHETGAARAFTRNGFGWGGTWNSLKDYMHFSTTNR
jgi:LysM repeat protein